MVAMVLANLDAEARRGEIDLIAQLPDGPAEGQRVVGLRAPDLRRHLDLAVRRARALGGENAGADVPPAVCDRAARWFLSTQGASGGWNYHRDEAAAARRSR